PSSWTASEAAAPTTTTPSPAPATTSSSSATAALRPAAFAIFRPRFFLGVIQFSVAVFVVTLENSFSEFGRHRWRQPIIHSARNRVRRGAGQFDHICADDGIL